MRNANLLLIAVLAVFTACKTTSKAVAQTRSADYEIAVGDTFTLKLPTNPSTGYSWKWVNKPLVSIVDTIGQVYTPSNSNPMIVGSGGTLSLSFKGLKSGLDSVKLDYNQGWNPNSSVKSKTFVVRVK